MEVAVLGHRGMLGSVVARYFAERGATIWTTDRRYDGSDEVPEWASRFDLAVNCIASENWRELADLPAYLSMACRGRVIHPSTDAIREDTPYAAMKREAEHNLAIIIRAGIVDERRSYTYTNWMCNPITPLEWAQMAWHHREAKPGIYQFGREPLSRYDIGVIAGQNPQPERAERDNSRVLPTRADLPPLDVALAEYRAWLQP